MTKRVSIYEKQVSLNPTKIKILVFMLENVPSPLEGFRLKQVYIRPSSSCEVYDSISSNLFASIQAHVYMTLVHARYNNLYVRY